MDITGRAGAGHGPQRKGECFALVCMKRGVQQSVDEKGGRKTVSKSQHGAAPVQHFTP